VNGADRPEVFRGKFKECLEHFAQAMDSRFPRGSKGTMQARKPLSDFCGVTIVTVSRWMLYRDVPIGAARIKLECFLEMQGYCITELRRIDQTRRNFTELIGYGILTAEEAAKILGYSCLSTCSAMLHGAHNPTDEKQRMMWDIWKEKKGILEEKKTEAQKHFCIDFARAASAPVKNQRPAQFHQPEPPKQASASRQPEPPKPRPELTSLQKAVIYQMLALLELLDGGLFDTVADALLLGLQESAEGSILRLSARLSELSARITMQKAEGDAHE
jgi:hypothetical protein